MFYPKMCFVRNRSSYSFETCTIVIGMPENLRVHGVWSSKYKEKWCFIPKCVLSETDHHTALKLVPLWLACLKTSGCMEFGPLNEKFGFVRNLIQLNTIGMPEVMEFYPKMCFVRNRSSYSFETCTIVIGMPENLRVRSLVKYKEKWCFSLVL